MGDADPVGRGLGCGEAAIRKVGERRLEADRADRLPLAIRAMARGAGGAEDLAAFPWRERVLRGDGTNGDDRDNNDR